MSVSTERVVWQKSLSKDVQIIETVSDRIAAIKLKVDTFNVYIIQVYLPCSSASIDDYKSEVDTCTKKSGQTATRLCTE